MIKEHKENNLCTTHLFLKELAENGWKIKSDGPKIKSIILHQAYKHWCEVTNSDFKKKTLITQLKKLDIICHNVRYFGKPTKCYILDKNIIRDKIADLLNDPNYKFDDMTNIDEEVDKFIEQRTQSSNELKKNSKKQKKSIHVINNDDDNDDDDDYDEDYVENEDYNYDNDDDNNADDDDEDDEDDDDDDDDGDDNDQDYNHEEDDDNDDDNGYNNNEDDDAAHYINQK